MGRLSEIEEIDAKLKKLRAKTAPIDKEIAALVRRRCEIVEQNKNSDLDTLFKGGITLKKIMSLDWDQLRDPWYKKVNSWLYDNVKYVKAGGYWAKTSQVAFSLWMDKSVPLEDQLDVLEVLKYVKPYDGAKHIGITDRNLSYYASYSMEVLEDGCAQVVSMCHGHRSAGHKFKDVKDCLEYIRENLWYEGGEYKDDE